MAKDSPKIQTQAPAFQEDPRFAQGLEDLLTTGRKLTNFDLTGGLSPLQDVINTSPETTSTFLEGLMAQLTPQFRDLQQETINQLAASNQLESSVAVDRLSRGQEDLQSNILASTTQFGLADISRALENRVRLTQLGLGATEAGTGLAADAESRKNQFALQNFENQLALETANRSEKKGGLLGGLTGAVGGGLSGFALGGPAGAGIGMLAGGVAGALGPSGTGGSILSSGAGAAGSAFRGGTTINPRSTATSRSIRDLDITTDPNANLAGGLSSLLNSRFAFA